MKRFGGKTFSTLALVAAFGATAAQAQYNITVVHNNDGESDLLADGGIGGIAEFKTLLDDTRNFYAGLGHGVVTISSGDNFLPSPEFQASLNSGDGQTFGSRTYYDALGIAALGYDAVIIGNHDFDAGPDVLADFIPQTGTTQYLSANLDFSAEPALQSLVTSGQIAPSTTISVPTSAGNKTIGIIGATTQSLPFITTTRDVIVNDVTTAVNAQIAALSGSVDHIIVASHLQGLAEDQALAGNLVDPSGKVALLIAGGGDEVLVNDFSGGGVTPQTAYGAGAPDSVLNTGVPGGVADTYPVTASGIPIVTTPGEYDYLGRVSLEFDASGVLTGVNASSNLQQVTGVVADPTVKATVQDPVAAFVAGLDADVIAKSSELLRGNSDRNVIRAEEAGLGNLVADAYLAAAQANPGSNDTAVFSFVNGGGIRDNIGDINGPQVQTSDISVGTTFDISPFGNIVSIVEDVTREDLKLIFENAYSRTVDGDAGPGIDPDQGPLGDTGRFLHLSENVSITYDITAQPLILDGDGNVTQVGERILELIINGETIIEDGVVVPGGTFDLTTADFTANGGDQVFNANFLSQDYAFTRLGVSDQQALEAYLRDLAGGDTNFDIITDSRYDNTPDGRIVVIPEPTSLALLAVGALMVARRRRG
jgi:5'-nucleotidase